MALTPLHLPAPMQGIVLDRNPLTMTPDQCLSAINLVANLDTLRVWGGNTAWATLANVSNLAELPLADGTRKLVAFTTGGAFDASTSGGVPSAISGATITTAPCYYTVYRHTLLWANGTDAPSCWTGTGSAGANGWSGSGLTVNNLIFPFVYKSRLWYVEKNVCKLWYGGLDVIPNPNATLTVLDLESLFTRGGYILFGAGTSRQTGALERELLAVVSSEGEVLVFQGDDPNYASSWGMIGRYFIPNVLGRRGFFYLNGSLHLLTVSGVLSLDQIMAADVNQAELSSFSMNIKSAFAIASTTTSAPAVHNYQCCVCQNKNYLLVHGGPTLGPGKTWLMNLNNNAWTCLSDTYTNIVNFGNNLVGIPILGGGIVKMDTGAVLTDLSTPVWVNISYPFLDNGDPSSKKIPKAVTPNVHLFAYEHAPVTYSMIVDVRADCDDVKYAKMQLGEMLNQNTLDFTWGRTSTPLYGANLYNTQLYTIGGSAGVYLSLQMKMTAPPTYVESSTDTRGFEFLGATLYYEAGGIL